MALKSREKKGKSEKREKRREADVSPTEEADL